jgi:hypothetical protein
MQQNAQWKMYKGNGDVEQYLGRQMAQAMQSCPAYPEHMPPEVILTAMDVKAHYLKSTCIRFIQRVSNAVNSADQAAAAQPVAV